MKRAGYFLSVALMTLAFPMTAFADDFEDFNDYQTEDGKYAYYFECGINVVMPQDWYQNTFIEADKKFVTFYHQESYERYLEDGYDTGGELLTIGRSVNTDFKDYPGYTYIGYDEEEMMNYYYAVPTDYRGYTEDEAVKAEYDQLQSELEEVCKSITLDPHHDDEWDDKEYNDDSEEAAEIMRKAAELQTEEKGGTIAGRIGGDEAEEKKSTELKEYTFDESKSDFDGTWVTFADAYQVYLPSYWDYYYLTEQEKQDGILYKAEGESEDIAVIINYTVIGNGAEELMANEDLAENFRRAGYRDVEQASVNGITSVTCSIPDEDISLIAFLNQEGNRIYMVMVNTDEETSMHYIDPILHSVKKA